MLLLFGDMNNLYCMGDGDRIMCNVFFEWIFVLGFGYIKYKIWFFRMVFYVSGFFFKKQVYEYKWNVIVNFVGGIGYNILNDNCVEIQVYNIKSQF